MTTLTQVNANEISEKDLIQHPFTDEYVLVSSLDYDGPDEVVVYFDSDEDSFTVTLNTRVGYVVRR